MPYQYFLTSHLTMTNQQLEIEEGVIDINKLIPFFYPIFDQFWRYQRHSRTSRHVKGPTRASLHITALYWPSFLGQILCILLLGIVRVNGQQVFPKLFRLPWLLDVIVYNEQPSADDKFSQALCSLFILSAKLDVE